MSSVSVRLFFDFRYCIMRKNAVYYILTILGKTKGSNMSSTREDAAQRLSTWLAGLEKFDLPDWDALPQLDLYMDQVILLLTRYLSPLERYGEDKAITASIINNYVRMKVMPPPVKKRYSRVHLAYLVMICTLKQSLSISCIQRMLPEDHSEESVQVLYADFVRQYRASIRFFCGLPGSAGQLTGNSYLPIVENGSLVTTSAILSTLYKSLTEFLLQEEYRDGPAEDDDDE